MSNSALVKYTRISPNCGNYVGGQLVKNRTHAIDKITIHHVAGKATIERLGTEFANPARQASANYGIGTDGRVGMYVPEDVRAWTSGSSENDNRAITIEVANDQLAPTWHVSDAVFGVLIELCVDICKRNGIKKLEWTGDKNGSLTIHKMFQATACPGPYLEGKMPEIAQLVNAKLAPAPAPAEETDEDIIYRVQTGAFRDKANAEKMAAKLKADGFATYIVEASGIYRVQVGAFKVKANAEKTAEALKAKGYACFITSPSTYTISEPVEPAAPKKTVDELAKEVIRGLWGNGADRKKRLTDAGYDYGAVQARVNQLMK